jgi:hypothetical protein
VIASNYFRSSRPILATTFARATNWFLQLILSTSGKMLSSNEGRYRDGSKHEKGRNKGSTQLRHTKPHDTIPTSLI